MVADLNEIVSDMGPVLRESILAVREAGERGLNVKYAWHQPRNFNPFSLVIFHKRNPGFLTGFSAERDPGGERVTLTDAGKQLSEMLLPLEPLPA